MLQFKRIIRFNTWSYLLTLTCWGWPQLQLPVGAEWTCWLGHQTEHYEWHHSGCVGAHSLEQSLESKGESRNHICWCLGQQSIKNDPKHKMSNTHWKGKFKENQERKRKTVAETFTIKWPYKLYDILSFYVWKYINIVGGEKLIIKIRH